MHMYLIFIGVILFVFRLVDFQAGSQMLSVLSARIKWKSRSRTQRTALILKGKRVIEGNSFEPSAAWPCTRRSIAFRIL